MDSAISRKNLSSTCSTMKWLNKVIYQNKLIDSRRIIKINFENKYLFILDTLVDNQLFANIIERFRICNKIDYSYLYYNIFNPTLPLSDNYSCKYESNLKPDYPLQGINYYGANAIAGALGARLLTEREWIYIASCGQNNEVKYAWGNEIPTATICNFGEKYGGVTPIRKFLPNKFGFYDLCGNIDEWVLDSNPIDDTEGCLKGGSWDKSDKFLNIHHKRYKWKRFGSVGIGFRLCWEEQMEDNTLVELI